MTENNRAEVEDKVHVYRRWCKNCGICIEFCPKDALAPDPDEFPELVRPEKCNLCGLCELRCPDFAISVSSPARKSKERNTERGHD